MKPYRQDTQALMTVITETRPPHSQPQIRPFDPRQHLGAVADLIELSFADTLDPDGREYLERMRSAANNTPWLNWISTAEWAAPAMLGFVWIEGDRVVGNASLIPYFIRGRRSYLIANVAVHPDYRRNGIGRRLTAEAIEYIRRRGSHGAWLHVREDNPAAEQLYRTMGFLERARRSSWLSRPEFEDFPLPRGMRIVSPRAGSWQQQRRWLEATYPPRLSWHMPIKIPALRPGLLGAIVRFFNTATIRQWAVVHNQEPGAFLSWQATLNYANALWLAAPERADEIAVLALLSHVRKALVGTRPLNIDYPAHRLEEVLARAGFTLQQTLIWMELPLSR